MNRFSQKLLSPLPLGTAFAALVLSFSSAGAQVIYQDSFSRTATALNGTAPETNSGTNGGTAGATWTAATTWTLDGSVAALSAGSSNAFLPFTPDLGKTYTLSLNLNPTSGDPNLWVAMGFLTNTTAGAATSPWQTTATPGPVMWQLLKPNLNVQTFGGVGTAAGKFTSTTGVLGGLYSITMQKTTASGDYTFSFSGPGITGANANSFTQNIPQTITGVGFGAPQGAVVGNVDNFTLSAVPEPSTYASFGLGALGLVALRVRSRQRAGRLAV